MSTRATYEFKTERGVKTTVYIHHDGYPSGAAGYLRAALALPNGNLAERFIRANERAEITSGHDEHGDTDYQYSVSSKGVVTVKKSTYVAPRTEGGDWVRRYDEIFKGSLEKFLAEYSPEAAA